MRAFSSAEIDAFVYGEASPELAQAIRDRAKVDDQFADGILSGSLQNLEQAAAA